MTQPASPPVDPAVVSPSSEYRWFTLPNLQAAATLLLGLLIARSLPPSDFGALASALSLVALLTVLVRLGIEQPFRQELTRNPLESATALGTAMAIRVAAAAVAYLLLALVAPAAVSTVWLVAALTLFLQAPLSLGGWLAGDPQKRSFALLAERIGFGSSVFMRLGLLYSNAPVTWYAAALALEATLAALVLFYAHGRLAPADEAFSWEASSARTWLKAGQRDLGHALLACSPLAVLQVLLVTLDSNADAGFFAAACLPVEFAAFVLAARAASISSNNNDTDQALVSAGHSMTTSRLCAMAWLVALVMGGPAYWTARWIFGADYAASGLPLTFLAIALVPVAIGASRGQRSNSTISDKHARLGQAVGLGLALMPGSLLILYWGATGAALAALLSLGGLHVLTPLFSPDTRAEARRDAAAALILPRLQRRTPATATPATAGQPKEGEAVLDEPVCLETTAIAHSPTQP